MDLYPAIDLRGGRCVRLLHGDYGRETVYGDDPAAQAMAFATAGAPWVHVVDLDAARSGSPENRAAVAAVVAAVAVPVQAGGGVRDDESAEALFAAGVRRVVVGTAALDHPGFVRRLAERHPGGVAVGLDVRGRDVAVRGWLESSGRDVAEVLAGYAGDGAPDVAAAVVTQIRVDGTLEGPDLAGLSELLGMSPLPLIASGGVGSLDDLRALAALEVAGRRLAGVVVGRALYEGAFTIEAALAALAAAGPAVR